MSQKLSQLNGLDNDSLVERVQQWMIQLINFHIMSTGGERRVEICRLRARRRTFLPTRLQRISFKVYGDSMTRHSTAQRDNSVMNMNIHNNSSNVVFNDCGFIMKAFQRNENLASRLSIMLSKSDDVSTEHNHQLIKHTFAYVHICLIKMSQKRKLLSCCRRRWMKIIISSCHSRRSSTGDINWKFTADAGENFFRERSEGIRI
jgi:hypothetical protein